MAKQTKAATPKIVAVAVDAKPARKRRKLAPYDKAVKGVKTATLAVSRAQKTLNTKKEALALAERVLATFKK